MQWIKKLFYPITATLSFIQTYFKSMLFLLLLFLLFAPQDTEFKPYNLAKIYLTGEIIDPQATLDEIEDAIKDTHIKGVLFVVDSPGGAVSPSIEISQAISRLNGVKPVIAYAAGSMASGSYYASIWSSKIIANPGSLIGSIGVIMQGMNVEKLIDKLGISTQIIKVGTYKESGTPTREWTSQERAELQRIANKTYEMFVNDVATARKLDPKMDKTFGDAHIFTAQEAKEVGLVDAVGTAFTAADTLAQLCNIDKPVWKEKDKFEKMMEKFANQTASQVIGYIKTLH